MHQQLVGSFEPLTTKSASGSADPLPARLGKMGTLADNSQDNEGLCLLFKRRTSLHEVCIEDNKLVIKRLKELTDSEWEEAKKIDKKFVNRSDVLKNLKKANIRYHMSYSLDNERTYVIVVIGMTHYKAEAWAQSHGLDCQIDAREAVQIGRKYERFLLAHRTYLKSDENEYFVDPIIKEKQKFKKLPLSLWDPIYITYEKSLNRKLYKRYPPHNHLLDNRMYLNILYDALQSPKTVGGAGFPLTKSLRNNDHPLVDVFALDGFTFNVNKNKYEINKPTLSKREYLLPQTEIFWDGKVREIRDYYGEWVAFYFAFLRHYMKWSYSFAIFGVLWFIAQLLYGEIADTHTSISLPGSTIGVAIALAWATLMSEEWYRKERSLMYKWGMMRYKTTEVPRAAFKGKLKVSKMTGELIESHQSKWKHYGKILCSMSTVFLCMSIVIIIVLGIWFLKSFFANNQTLSYSVAFANSIQIQVMNKLYTYLAVYLNDFEGHRLELEYYNHLIIKRILFFVVNSFNSLFYIAFFRSDSDYGNSDEKRLEALRTQLIILFVTLTIFQNCLEIFLPLIKAWVLGSFINYQSNKLSAREQQRMSAHASDNEDDNNNNENEEKQSKKEKKSKKSKGISARVMSTMTVGNDDDDNEDNNNDINNNMPLQVTPEMWEDIELQIKYPKSPDVLNNTAEIIVQYGYIMLFVFIFPLMPLLGLMNNFLETRIDFNNLVTSRRGIPFAADGIGVWKKVLSAGAVCAVFTNMTLITWRTTVVTDFLGSTDTSQVLTFYFIVVLFCLVFQFVARFLVPDESQATLEAIGRQSECEKHLLLAAGITAEDVREKHIQMSSNWEDENESDNNNNSDDIAADIKEDKERKESIKNDENNGVTEEKMAQQHELNNNNNNNNNSSKPKLKNANSGSSSDDSIRTDTDHDHYHDNDVHSDNEQEKENKGSSNVNKDNYQTKVENNNENDGGIAIMVIDENGNGNKQ